jgi:putative phage-type endonuclease
MPTSVYLPLEQRSPEWLEARRSLITATDIPVLLGLSPYACEADLADEKLGRATPREATIRMRIGTALEPLIGQEYTRLTGRKVQLYRTMLRHPSIEWAAASPDFRVVGERRLVEAKRASRSRFADGVPQDIEAQVAWQLGVSGMPVADVAVLVEDELQVHELAADAGLFEDLLAVAADFRRRLAAGGPFSRNIDRLKRDYPRDNGETIVADADVAAAVLALIDARRTRKGIEQEEERLEEAIKARMADAAVMVGDGFRVTWKQTKDVETTDWKSIADGLLRQLPETEREALVGLHTASRAGFRPFRIVEKGE